MKIEINKTALEKAKKLIRQGNIDATSLLNSHSDELIIIDKGGSNDFSCGSDDTIYRRGVIAAKARADARGENDISNALSSLLHAIDKKLKKDSVGVATGEMIKGNMRIDYYDAEWEEYLEESFKTTDEGYLKGRAIFTNIGVFPYLLEDGSVRWELRPPEEVFHWESIDSFKMLPMTNDHPTDAVDIENIKEFQVGYSGEEVRTSEYHLSIPIVITDKNTIEDCQISGKRALSGAYSVDLEMKSGVWMGVPYNAIQRNIRGNHIAVVDIGRAGDDAVMKFDSIGFSLRGKIQNDSGENKNLHRRNDDMKTIKRDGVEYQADQKIIDLLTDAEKNLEKLKVDHDELKDEKTKIEATRDQANEEMEAMKADDKEKLSTDAIEKAVQLRMVVFDAARRAKVELKADMKEDEIKKAVIISLSPKTAVEKLDKSSYLDARFDLALEKLDELDEQGVEFDAAMADDSLSKVPAEVKVTSDAAYEKMVSGMNDAWKPKEVQ